MTFSIRNLLALVAVVALAIVAWRSHQDAQQKQLRLATVLSAIKSAELALRIDNPQLHHAMLSTIDEYEAVRTLREQCDANLEQLREKYGAIIPRGPGVVSIRNLPSIRGDTGKTPVEFRIYIPEERELWLKYGVQDMLRNIPANPDFEQRLLRQSPFDHGGPYEMLLSPGEHTLSVKIGDDAEDFLPYKITLDEKVLIDSACKHATYTGGGITSSTEQSDFHDRELPQWGGLMSATLSVRDDQGKVQPATFQFLLCLSDESSGFMAFPGAP